MGSGFKIDDKDAQKKLAEGINAREGSGWLGKIWGVTSSVPHNIAALTIFVLLLFGIIYTYSCINIPSEKLSISIAGFWGIISPIITLSFGYLFGKGKH